jgi:hypothetical protein
MTQLTLPLLVLDPASLKIGWALFGFGPHGGPQYIYSNVFCIPETAPQDERVLMVGSAINSIIDDCRSHGYPPATALIEVPDYLAEWAKFHITVYFRAVGVAEYAAFLRGLKIKYIKASKEKRENRKQTAKERFRAEIGRYANTDDESDAYCIGVDYLNELLSTSPPL